MDGKWRPGVARSGKGGEERGEAGWLVYAAGQEQGGDPATPRVRTVGRIWMDPTAAGAESGAHQLQDSRVGGGMAGGDVSVLWGRHWIGNECTS